LTFKKVAGKVYMLRASKLLRSSERLKGMKEASGDKGTERAEILVVTGDSVVLRVLEATLREMGYEVVGARDRDEAEEYLGRHRPIMVICDVDLPGDSAYDLCRSLKGSPNTTSIPFVFISNRGEFPNKKLGFESGADDYITKPLKLSEVKDRIEPLLRRGRAERREESSTGGRKAREEAPEPQDILREILSREKTAEEPGKKKARLSSMDFIKKKLKDKTERGEEAKIEAEVPGGEDEQIVNEAERTYQDSIRRVSEWLNMASQGGLIDVTQAEKVSRSLVEKINSDDLLLSMMPEAADERDLAHRSVCTAILSLKVGKGLGYPEEKLSQLGVAALLHLVGMARGPEEVRENTERVKDYPLAGAELLRASLRKYGIQEYSWLPEVVSQIEEQEDGRGFPQGLTGNQIHEYAKVIAVAKRYLDFIHPLSSAERIIPYEAVKRIIQMQEIAFPPTIVSAFVKEISIFPVGSWVQLSNGEIGMVLSNDSTHPLRPTVEVLYGPSRTSLPSKKKLNLVEAPFIFITKPIDENEIVGKEQSKNSTGERK